MTGDLHWLLAPIDCEVFFQSYWCKAALRISRNEREYYRQLLPNERLEYALYSACGIPGAVEELGYDQSPARVRGYTAAQNSLKMGKSLRIDAVQRFSRELAMFGRALETGLGCPININLYFSPGSGRALKQHYDTHDVFVLQMYGRKKWRLFNPPVPFPLEYYPPARCERRWQTKRRRNKIKDSSADERCVPADEFTLLSGDMLYLPRGFWHVAEAEPDCFSCHLTVGVQSFTYLDLMTVAMTQAALQVTGLREPLPLGFGSTRNSTVATCQKAMELVKILPEHLTLDTACAELAEIFVGSRQSIGIGLLDEVGPEGKKLGLESSVSIRDGIMFLLTNDESHVLFKIDSKTVALPSVCEMACRFITNRRQFTPRELPGDLSDSEKIALIERLVAEGLLVPNKESETTHTARAREDLRGWLPVKLDLRSNRQEVEWVYFDHNALSEPMFSGSVARLRSNLPPAPTRFTGLEDLSNFRGADLPIALILHISRCGSTLVSNAMRYASGTVVISEAQVFGPLLTPPKLRDNSKREGVRSIDWETLRDALLLGAMRAFSQRRLGDEAALVVKLTSWQIIALPILRRLWPDAPILLVIRDPVEVMVSCIEKPPGWMGLKKNNLLGNRIFGSRSENPEAMSNEAFCARAIGKFLRVASAHMDANCRVLDYAGLDESRILQVMRFFGLDVSNIDSEGLDRCLKSYSKDGHGIRAFMDDRDLKQKSATDLIRREAEASALDAYAQLKSLEKW